MVLTVDGRLHTPSGTYEATDDIGPPRCGRASAGGGRPAPAAQAYALTDQPPQRHDRRCRREAAPAGLPHEPQEAGRQEQVQEDREGQDRVTRDREGQGAGQQGGSARGERRRAGHALPLPAAPPLVAGRPADPQLGGDMRHRPPRHDPLDEQPAPVDGQLRPNLRHETSGVVSPRHTTTSGGLPPQDQSARSCGRIASTNVTGQYN